MPSILSAIRTQSRIHGNPRHVLLVSCIGISFFFLLLANTFSGSVRLPGPIVSSRSASSSIDRLFPTPGQGSWVDTSICSDSCPFSNDGICQEGRAPGPSSYVTSAAGSAPDGPFTVLCDLGTDCSDCGPWEYRGPKEALQWTPVKDLTERNVQLNVRLTSTPTPFWMPYTDPAADIDVSGQMADISMIEPGLTWVWHKLLKEGCIPSGSSDEEGNNEYGVTLLDDLDEYPHVETIKQSLDGTTSTNKGPIVLDVGANFGYYSLMSAAMGCRVVAWEPVPKFSNFFKYGLLRNAGMTGRVHLREKVVSGGNAQLMTMVVPTTGIWGTAGINGLNLNNDQRHDGTEEIKVRSEKVDDVIPAGDKLEDAPEILIMKIDVEGFEPSVMSSAKKLFMDGNVRNLIMEYSPGVAEANKDWVLAESNPGRLLGMIQHGYTILQMNEPLRVLNGFDWDGDLPPMPHVTMDALRHDVDDTKRSQSGTLGCPLPASVELTGGLWECPPADSDQPAPWQFERLSPKGFRSTFGYNTNIWAFRDADSPAVKGAPATLVPLEEMYTVNEQWFVPGELTYPYYPGHEFRKCANLDAKDQVRFRCRCSNKSECGSLEAVVKAAQRQGEMPPLPLKNATLADMYKIENW